MKKPLMRAKASAEKFRTPQNQAIRRRPAGFNPAGPGFPP